MMIVVQIRLIANTHPCVYYNAATDMDRRQWQIPDGQASIHQS